MGGPVGLDVTAITSVLNLCPIAPADQLTRLDQVQLIERGALAVLNARDE